MTGNEFVANYIMHDSSIENLKISNNRTEVILDIYFAFWMQDNYNESDPEMGTIKVTFHDVSEYEIPDNVGWDSISILSTSIENGCIKFSLTDDSPTGYFEMKIKSDNVTITIENEQS